MESMQSDAIRNILGKTIHRVVHSKDSESIVIILFTDRETYIRLEEQDYYCYHDCSSRARELYIGKHKEHWSYYNESMKNAKDLP